MFGEQTKLKRGLTWYEYGMFLRGQASHPPLDRLRLRRHAQPFRARPRREGVQQSAPVIKLPPRGDRGRPLALLGLLNSSTACFWMKQVFHNKGSSGDRRWGYERDRWREVLRVRRHEARAISLFPTDRPTDSPRQLDDLAQRLAEHASPACSVRIAIATASRLATASRTLAQRCQAMRRDPRQMIALQEELDWECYRLYGLLDEDLTDVHDRRDSRSANVPSRS